jgi:hypothetical protein
MATCRSFSKNKGKINSQPILNENSPWAHTESELDVHGVKYMVLLKEMYISITMNNISKMDYTNSFKLKFKCIIVGFSLHKIYKN